MPGGVDRVRERHEQHDRAQQRRCVAMKRMPATNPPLRVARPPSPRAIGRRRSDAATRARHEARDEHRRDDEPAASTTSAGTGPSSATSAPATPAPTIVAVRCTADCAPAARASGIRASAARSGMSDGLRGVAGRVEQAAEEHEREQHAERQADGGAEHRDREHGEPARDIRDDARGAVAEPVDEHAAEGAADDERHRREHARDARRERRAGLRQGDDRDRDERDRVAAEREELGREEARARRQRGRRRVAVIDSRVLREGVGDPAHRPRALARLAAARPPLLAHRLELGGRARGTRRA